jgi:hypothetical protein
MAEIDIKKLAAQLDAAHAILDQIRVTSGCALFGPARSRTAERLETALVTARKALNDRRARAAFIGSEEIFGEPAWDILLDLFIRQAAEHEDGSKAFAKASASESTAMRWLRVLEQTGLVGIEADPGSGQRCLVHLTPTGYEGMLRYLESIAG